MNGVEIKVTSDRTGKLPLEVRKALLAFERGVAAAIKDDAVANAPHGHPGDHLKPSEMGAPTEIEPPDRIAKSIAVEEHPRKQTPEVWVGLKGYWAYIGRFAEFGTVKEEARPFMGPAAERQRPGYASRASEVLNVVIEKE